MRGMDLRTLASVLATGRYGWLVPAIVVIVTGQWARAIRWRMLFGRVEKPSARDTFWIISVGYLVSTVLPLRLGDPMRAWLVETRTPAGGAEALAAVVVERVLDLITIFAMLAIWLPAPAAVLLEAQLGAGWWSSPGRLRIATASFVLLAYAVVLVMGRASGLLARVGGNMAALATRLPGIRVAPADARRFAHGQIERFGGAFHALSRPSAALAALSWSAIVWGLGGLSYWLVMPATGLQPTVSAAVFAMGAAALFAIIPSSPGYVGVFHAAVVAALWILLDIPREQALGYAIVLHAVTFLTLIVLGVAGMWSLGLRWEGLSRRAQRLSGGDPA